MLRILIADASEVFSHTLAGYLKDAFAVHIYENNESIIDLICTYKPDTLVLDLMLPGWDGITVLQTLKAIGIHPVVLAISRVTGYYIQDSLEQLGVAYMMARPCNPRAAAERVKDIARYPAEKLLPETDEKEIVINMLRSLGLTEGYMGFHCLVAIIPRVSDNPRLSYTKELYPDTAKLLGSSPKQVERGIRTIIDKAWINRCEAIWQQYFPETILHRQSRPTNSIFISRLAQILSEQKKSISLK